MVPSEQVAGDAGAARKLAGCAAVGTTTLRDLMSRSGRQPVLLEHHVLMLVTVGRGTHEVDFHAHECRPGTLIWARPGQVIRYTDQADLDAVIVCWRPGALPPLAEVLEDLFGPTSWQLAGEDEDAVINDVSQLVVDCQRHGGGGQAALLLRHQLAVLLLRVALLPTGHGRDASAETATFQRLRQEVERSYARTRRVEDYAAAMNCSVRTLTRACLAATARSAKQIVDERVALQARRLLAASELSVAEVGRRLGFPEPTNFGRFFQREVGCSPGAFRAAIRTSPECRGPVRRRPL